MTQESKITKAFGCLLSAVSTIFWLFLIGFCVLWLADLFLFPFANQAPVGEPGPVGTRIPPPENKRPHRVTRTTDLRCPEQVQITEPAFVVSLGLTADEAIQSRDARAISLRDNAPIRVSLASDAHFEALADLVQERNSLADAEERPFAFTLRPKALGKTTIVVDVQQGTQPLATLTATIEVIEKEPNQNDEESTAVSQQVMFNATITPPSILLLVNSDPRSKQLSITMVKGNASAKPFDPVPLIADTVEGSFNGIYDELNKLIDRRDASSQAELSLRRRLSPEEVDIRLKQIGQNLWDRLIPRDLKEEYLSNKKEWIDSTVLIHSNEPYIPWELLWPYDARGSWEDEGPWCQTLLLSRWLNTGLAGKPHLPAPEQIGISRVAVLTPRYKKLRRLPAAEEERHFLSGLIEARSSLQDVSPPNANWDEVNALIRSGRYDLLHIISHGSFNRSAQGTSAAIWLDGERALIPDNFVGPQVNRHMQTTRPMFFFNACEAGQRSWGLSWIRGWPDRLIGLGAGVFVAPLFEVKDTSAKEFSHSFYKAFFDGDTVAEAARKARQKARSSGDPTWAAYSVYSHPNALLEIDKRKLNNRKLRNSWE